jgi:hypothetical protein
VFFMALLLFVATPAPAETFGPVTVEVREGVATVREGTYFEHRFTVFNPTAEPHLVRIEVSGEMIGGTGQPRVSRTVVAAPRSSGIVSLPQYVITEYVATDARIEVDNRYAGMLRVGGYTATSYRTPRDILFGRAVPAEFIQPVVPTEEVGNAVRPQVAPASWSANWLHYTPFSGVVLTTRDWNELPRPVQAALLRWTAAGGSLTLIGGAANLPLLRPATDLENVMAGHHGFGYVVLIPADADPAVVAPALHLSWRRIGVDSRYMWYSGMNQTTPVPLLDDASLPVKSLFSVLVAFVVVGGPLNLWLLAKKKKRLWIFWTLPALAIVTALILVGALIANEGWVRIHKTVSLTLLDERNGEAATLGWTGVYATLSPEPDVRFDSATEVRPMFASPDVHTDWSDGQRFVSGWIGSRLARGFAIRKVESRRERVPVRREGGHLVAVNGLGSELKELWVADETGAVHFAANVPAGKEIALARTANVVTAGRDPAQMFGGVSSWASYHGRVSGDPKLALQPNTYVAVLKRSPFVEPAVAKPTKYTSEASVIGLMKGIDDAR